MNCKHRKNTPQILAIVLASTLFFSAALAGAEESAAGADRQRYMFIDEVRPGMKGYGLTVFSGTTIERFDVEIISVVYSYAPQSDLILARVTGGPLEKTGVIAGMSGSPIYIDDRIIGALAYSWPFPKDTLAGITPIGEMLEIFDFGDGGAGGAEVAGGTSTPVEWAREASFSVALPAAFSEPATMRPIMTPMAFSGFSREAIDVFRPQLEGWGVVPVLGGSFSERLTETSAPFEEGAAVGVQIVRGDMNATAIGTLTVKDGERVLAFGHPFMLSGSVDFPMTTAYIHTVIPSMVISSKLGSSLKPVGALTQDRRSGIAGIIGGLPEMVPFTLRVRRKGEDTDKIFRFEIARNPRLLPPMAGMALGSALVYAGSQTGEFTANVTYEIVPESFPPIRNDDFIAGMRGFPALSALGLVKDLAALLNNQFAEVSIRSVSMHVEVQEAVESARITGVRVSKETFKPGEDIELKVIMKPYMKDYIEKTLLLPISSHFVEGQAFVQVSAAPQTAAFEKARAPSRLQATSIEKLVKLIDEDYPGNRLDVRILITDPGLIVDGEEMSALPSSVLSVIAQSAGKEPMGPTRSSVVLEKQFFLDFEVEGIVIIPITIDRRGQ